MKRYAHVLAATDLSPASEAAVLRAADLAGHDEGRISLLHVVEFFPEDTPLTCIAPEDKDPATYLREHAHGRLAELIRRLDLNGVIPLVQLSTHSAGYEIVRSAREQQVDAIVVSAHGRGSPGEHPGATADAVVRRAHCDVVVVREG